MMRARTQCTNGSSQMAAERGGAAGPFTGTVSGPPDIWERLRTLIANNPEPP